MTESRDRRLLPVTTGSEAARQLFELGRHAAFHYQFAQARGLLDAALAEDPAFVLALLHRGGSSLPNERRRFFDLAEANRVNVTEDEGRLIDAFVAFLWDGRIADAVSTLSDLADRYPDDPYLPTYLGLRYFRNLGEFDEAHAQFRRALERDPGFSQAHLWLGQVDLARGRFESAEAEFLAYAELAPDQPRPRDCLGMLAMGRGQFDEAEVRFREALALDPQFADSREHLSRVEVEVRRGELASAIEDGDVEALANFVTGLPASTLPSRLFSPAIEARGDRMPSLAEGVTGMGLEVDEFHLGLEGDVATESGRYRLRGLGDDIETGRFIAVWVLSVDGWKVHDAVWEADVL